MKKYGLPVITKDRRKKINRSGSKCCDICHAKELLIEHHINGRDIKNPNHPSNLANICPNCHYKLHHGKIIIEGWTQTSLDKELFWHSVDENSFTGKESKTHVIVFK